MSKASTHHVQLAGSGRAFEVAAGETVLEAARRAGLALPYSCLSGNCGSCKAHVLSGAVSYPYNPPTALSAAESARGQALLCQAVPASDLTWRSGRLRPLPAFRSASWR